MFIFLIGGCIEILIDCSFMFVMIEFLGILSIVSVMIILGLSLVVGMMFGGFFLWIGMGCFCW